MVLETYNFSDFTTSHYKLLLEKAKTRFDFLFFDEVKDNDSFILWRHDVDFSMHRAYRLAQLEHESGVKSTFFVHLHNEYYNFLEKPITSLVCKIGDLGHKIGLHFDSHYYDIQSEAELEDKIAMEADILRKFLQTDIDVFSFHVTTPFTMNCKEWSYGGLINTYADYFQHNVEYCSDSNGYWRYKRLSDVLENTDSKKVQILTHPEWWQEETMSPWQRIERCIEGRAGSNKQYYIDNLRKWGMKNIGWEGELL
jgi:hypothetical protein